MGDLDIAPCGGSERCCFGSVGVCVKADGAAADTDVGVGIGKYGLPVLPEGRVDAKVSFGAAGADVGVCTGLGLFEARAGSVFAFLVSMYFLEGSDVAVADACAGEG